MRLACALLAAGVCWGQALTQRGFLDTRWTAYPRRAPSDSGRAVAEALLRYEAGLRACGWLRLAGAFEARADSHRQVEREARLDWRDRGLERPALSIRRLSAIVHRGPVTLELGKQFIRWGKTDILNPTDRFAPKDFLSVVNSDLLAVSAARLTLERGGETLDLVWSPQFTPSRTPLLGQRWTVLPAEARAIRLREGGARFPGGSQWGVRWNRVGRGVEYSASFYDGFNHLPLFEGRLEAAPLRVEFSRFYPRLRMYGADAAAPLPWFTLKGEAAYFTTTTPQADEYVLYVVQLERQAGEWTFGGGYAGQYVTERRNTLDFAPDRGLTRAVLGRAAYTIDTNRSLALETAVRQNGQGSWVKAEYSQALGQHWRATAALAWMRGQEGDFLGQYYRNSHAMLVLRYSF